MKPSHIILIVGLALAAGFGGATLAGKTNQVNNAAAAETVYDRVVRTGTIRCGYSAWQPLLFIDPNTKQITGIFHDLMEEVGKRLELKIDWAEDLGWDTVVESIKTGRVDMACAGYWLHPARIKNVYSTIPQFYSALYIWVRNDEARSFQSLNDLNNEAVTVGLIDGGSSEQIIKRLFPKAKSFALPGNATNGNLTETVLTGKADLMIDDITSFMEYNRSNPGKLRLLFPDQPLAIFPATMLLPPGDQQLKSMIDNTLILIELDGTLDQILQRYQADKVFLRNPQPLQFKGNS